MPLHTLKKNMQTVALGTVVYSLSIAYTMPVFAESQADNVLPKMVVTAIRKADNTFIQKSEVAWHDSNDLSIAREKDGTYTAASNTNPFSLKSLLISIGSPTLNIDFGYAVGSASMNADGNLALSTLIETLNYLDDEVTLQVTPTQNSKGESDAEIMRRRLAILSKKLARMTQVNFKVMPAKLVSAGEAARGRSDVWRIQVRRATLKSGFVNHKRKSTSP